MPCSLDVHGPAIRIVLPGEVLAPFRGVDGILGEVSNPEDRLPSFILSLSNVLPKPEGSWLMDAIIDSAQRPPLPPLLKEGSGRALWVAGFPR